MLAILAASDRIFFQIKNDHILLSINSASRDPSYRNECMTMQSVLSLYAGHSGALSWPCSLESSGLPAFPYGVEKVMASWSLWSLAPNLDHIPYSVSSWLRILCRMTQVSSQVLNRLPPPPHRPVCLLSAPLSSRSSQLEAICRRRISKKSTGGVKC